MKSFFLIITVLFSVTFVVAQTEPEVVSTDESTTRRTIDDVRETVDPKDEIVLPKTVKKTAKAESPAERKKKMVFYLDLLTKTETRAETLRKSLFDMIEKENSVKTKVRNLEYSLRPEQLRNATALSGSLRPEQVRDAREKMLKNDIANLNMLLQQIASNRLRLESSLRNADLLTERVRKLFEFYVDSAIQEDLAKIL